MGANIPLSVISIPAILGIGFVIDGVPEATGFQRIKGYIIDGLLYNLLTKTFIACIVGIVVSLAIFKRRQSN